MEIRLESYQKQVLESFKHIFTTLFRSGEESERLSIVGQYPEEEKREIAILIHFIGGVEGKIVLSCSKNTAMNITKALNKMSVDKDLDPVEEKETVKNSIGEIMNILAGKLAYSFQREYGTTRITTPAMVSGMVLFITVYDENSLCSYIDSRFGVFEIILSITKG